jgi:hypothetical protein
MATMGLWWWWRRTTPAPTRWRIPDVETHRYATHHSVAASQREDHGVELPANIKGTAARKVIDKLIRAGLLEEVRACGALPVWRRDDDSGPMALRITKSGLEAIDVEDGVTAALKETRARPTPAREVETPAPKAVASRRPTSVTAQKSARKKRKALAG